VLHIVIRGDALKNEIKWGKLLGSVLIPLALGGVSAWLTRGSMAHYGQVYKPVLSPPGWLFPVVWTILYVLMGLASYLILRSDAPEEKKKRALTLYAVQLLVNVVWPLIFFNAERYLLAFLWLVALFVLVWVCAARFRAVCKRAGDLLIPYLVWLFFAGYLNLGVYLLN